MKKILLSNGGHALVDNEDFEFINRWRWVKGNSGYAQRGIYVNGRGTTALMHRLILRATHGQQVEHRDNDPLNNTKINLRFSTQAQNMHNRKINKNNTSAYKGVNHQNGRWRARIMHERKHISLGLFDTAKEAASAYNIAALQLDGEFAKVNNI